MISAEDLDVLIDGLLCCDSRQQMERALVRFGANKNREAELSIEEGEKWIRRRANRRSDYPGPVNRKSRVGKPWTWMEMKIMSWAFSKDYAESKVKPDFEYIAVLLQRTAKEVEDQERVRTTTRRGMRGFV